MKTLFDMVAAIGFAEDEICDEGSGTCSDLNGTTGLPDINLTQDEVMDLFRKGLKDMLDSTSINADVDSEDFITS